MGESEEGTEGVNFKITPDDLKQEPDMKFTSADFPNAEPPVDIVIQKESGPDLNITLGDIAAANQEKPDPMKDPAYKAKFDRGAFDRNRP